MTVPGRDPRGEIAKLVFFLDGSQDDGAIRVQSHVHVIALTKIRLSGDGKGNSDGQAVSPFRDRCPVGHCIYFEYTGLEEVWLAGDIMCRLCRLFHFFHIPQKLASFDFPFPRYTNAPPTEKISAILAGRDTRVHGEKRNLRFL
jgi:hypothetical protein